jgi:alanyl-tRNA synthetase
LKSGIGVLGADGEKPMVVVVVSPDLVKSGVKAGVLAKTIGAEMGGGGGGKPHIATAGGQDSTALKSAMNNSLEIIKEAFRG